MPRLLKDSVVLVLAGEAGQGIQAIEAVLTALLKREGYHVFASKEYMSRVRGGTNSVTISVSSTPNPVLFDRIDILLPLAKEAIPHLASRITPETTVIGDAALIGHPGMIDVPFQKLATVSGSAIMANTLAAGVVAGLLGVNPASGGQFMVEYFQRKSVEVQTKNRDVFLAGHARGQDLRAEITVEISHDPSVSQAIMVTGNEAVALGMLGGGVQYVVAYPMSPGTSVMELLAEYSRDFDIVIEQVEDEIGVVNMALGAWYAGARTLVTTSGGGFALMVEGVSLAGMAEIPLVVHIAQRPGPATGLPTRTEQGDLFLAAFAGHGEFARLVLAPGDLEEAFALAQASLDFADRFQVPAFLLSDQFLLDSYYTCPPFDQARVQAWLDQLAARAKPQPGLASSYQGTLAPAGLSQDRDQSSGSFIVPTKPDYRRSLLTQDGLSPRGIPGYGTGVVTADSDEHDETGHITEDLRLRNDLVHKRQAKAELLRSAIPLPRWSGPAKAEIAIVGWGSTKNVISAALDILRSERPSGAPAPSLAHVHFSWVYPFPEGTGELLCQARQLILVENNTDGQLGRLLRMDTGIQFAERILQYNGLAFSVETLTGALRTAVAKLSGAAS